MNFTLPVKANGLAFRFLQTANAALTITGSSDLIHKGSAGGSSVTFSTTNEKIGSHALVECIYTANSTLRWLDSPESDTNARRGFCDACGSGLFWDAPGRATISISAGSLDEPSGLETIGHVYVEQAADYYALPDDGLPKHARLSG